MEAGHSKDGYIHSPEISTRTGLCSAKADDNEKLNIYDSRVDMHGIESDTSAATQEEINELKQEYMILFPSQSFYLLTLAPE